MFTRQVRYLKRLHSKKLAYWTRAPIFWKLNLDRNDNWVEINPMESTYSCSDSQYRKVHPGKRPRTHPDDPKSKDYWAEPEKRKVREFTFKKIVLSSKQSYTCPVCKESLFNGEEVNILHLTPKRQRGNWSV